MWHTWIAEGDLREGGLTGIEVAGKKLIRPARLISIFEMQSAEPFIGC
jgi:hypothetical protein